MSWPTVKLGDICDLLNGYAFKSSDYVDNSNTLSCRMSNIRPGGVFDIDYNARYLPDGFSDKYKQFLLKDGDVIIAMTDLADSPKILGVPTVVETKGKNILLNQRVGKLVIKDESRVHFPYLKLALNYPKVRAVYKRFAGGGLQINLGKADLLNVEIPLPYPDDPEKSLKEQKRIAAILDKADGIRRKRQQAIQLADDFLRSVFLDMFGDPVTNSKGWEVKPLGESCSLQGGYAFKSKDYTDIGTPIVKITNVHFEDLDWSDVDYVPESFVASKSGFLLSTGDLVMAMTRPIIKSLGAVKVVEVKDSDLPCLLNQRVGRFTGYGSSFNRDFLKYFLYSSYFKNEVEKLCSVALQPNVSAKQIESIPAYLPAMELQNKFSLIVSEVKNASRGMVKAEKVIFFEALSQKAFKGEL